MSLLTCLPRYELEEASLQGLVEPLPLLSMIPLVTQGSTPPRHNIQRAATLDSDQLTSPHEGSGSLGVRSSLESGCPSLDTQLEEAEEIEAARDEGEGEAGQYLCPVYQGGPSSTPGPPVLMVPLPAGSQTPDYWVQRRVAMYLSQH